MTDTRSALLAAAAEEFARHGLMGARVAAIVARAGVNERMVYHWFASKEGLYQAVVEDQRRRLGTAWRPVLEEAAAMGPREGIRHALLGFHRAINRYPLLPALLTHEWLASLSTSPYPAAADLPPQLRSLYEAGQRDGVFTRERPFEVAYLTSIGAIVGLASFAPQFAAALGADDPAATWSRPDRLAELIVDQLVDGLTGPPRDGGPGPHAGSAAPDRPAAAG